MQALLLLSGTTRAARDELEIESVFKPPHCADNAVAAGAFVEVRTVGRVADYAAGVGWVPRKGPKPFDDQGTFLLGSGEPFSEPFSSIELWAEAGPRGARRAPPRQR